ncbi:MAG TPA: metallophosphoesterase [Planctomycetaceae bacterium]|nr:metallophosphoesterase [Planctomycetaceae bacterium]
MFEFRYLNAGRGPGQFYEDRLPVHLARVDRLPEGVTALVATADLQGRERFEDAPNGSIRLLGEALPQRLVKEVLPALSLNVSGQVGVLLSGDFYIVPALDQRGGTGDVSRVWHAFAESFAWVAGIPGNHDTFGEPPQRRPRLPARMHFLDGDVVEAGGLRIAGLGGIIGKASRPNRRSEDDYLLTLQRLLQAQPDVLLMHEGPDGLHPSQRGLPQVRAILVASEMGLVIRGHAHWDQPFVEFPSGLQVLNVDARVVILTC